MRPEIWVSFRLAKPLNNNAIAGERMSAQEAQLRSVVVLLISVVQACIRELLEEHGDRLGTSWSELTEIEKRYVSVQSVRRMTKFFEENPDDELPEARNVDSLRQAIFDCASWQNNPALLSNSPHRQKLDGFLQNNGSNVLDKIISRYSACELSFFNWLNKFHPRYRGLSDVLDTIIATRNDAAHGTFTRRVTIRDVRVFRVLIYRMLMKIPRYIAARVDGNPPMHPTRESIAERAYFLWLSRGSGDQGDTEDWLKAERDLS